VTALVAGGISVSILTTFAASLVWHLRRIPEARLVDKPRRPLTRREHAEFARLAAGIRRDRAAAARSDGR